LLAHFGHWALFSALAVQLYLYHQAFPNDKLFIKCMVYTIYAIKLAGTVLPTRDAFITFGYGFGDVSTLLRIGTYWFTCPVMDAAHKTAF
ncbi:hypothetical protein K438DRAFT_1572783, partial [Mycena galopus ATCC 62051]